MAMIRYQMFIDEGQKRMLEEMHQRLHVPVAELVRRAIGRFVDEQNWLIQAMFKLYPWEQMLRDDYAEPLPTADVTVLEPW